MSALLLDFKYIRRPPSLVAALALTLSACGAPGSRQAGQR